MVNHGILEIFEIFKIIIKFRSFGDCGLFLITLVEGIICDFGDVFGRGIQLLAVVAAYELASLRLPGVDLAGAVEVVLVDRVVVALQLTFCEISVDDTVHFVSDVLDSCLSAQGVADGLIRLTLLGSFGSRHF